MIVGSFPQRHVLSAADDRLLAALRKNARTSLLRLAKELGIPHSTVHSRVRKYHGKAIIKSTALLNFTTLGYARACIAIKASPVARKATCAAIMHYWGLNNLQKLNSGYDYLAEIIGNNAKELEDFVTKLKEIPGVIDVQKFTIMEDVAREVFTPGGST
jgi:DNA-binding Lrp family transcriptional regulator